MPSLQNKFDKPINVIKLLYTPTSLVFIIYFSYLNKELLARMLDAAEWKMLAASICFWCTLHLLAPVSTKAILQCFGHSITYSRLLDIYISRLPARYLPGGIWHTVGRMSAYYTHGVSKKDLTLLGIVETLFPCLITLFLGGGYLWFITEQKALSNLEGALSLTNLIILLAIPIIVKHQIPSLWKKNFLYFYFYILVISVFFWGIASFSFIFYYNSISIGAEQTSFFKIAATYIFSWGIGYISIIAPQGIGVFEIVAGKLLPLPMSLGGAVAFIAGFRIVSLFSDSLVWITYRFYQLLFPGKSQQTRSS